MSTFALLLAACGSAPDPAVGSINAAVNEKPVACPAIAILCIEGYHPKDAGKCHLICVPDHGDECQSDADCTIYCITQSCPSGRCTGGTCRISIDKRPPKQTNTCKPRCAPGFHCQECKTVEGSDFFCMPDGAAC